MLTEYSMFVPSFLVKVAPFLPPSSHLTWRVRDEEPFQPLVFVKGNICAILGPFGEFLAKRGFFLPQPKHLNTSAQWFLVKTFETSFTDVFVEALIPHCTWHRWISSWFRHQFC